MKWYVSQNLKPQGPFTNAQVHEWIVRGQIRPYELAQKSELADWKPMCEYREFPSELFPAFQCVQAEADWQKVAWYIQTDGQMWDHQLSFQQIKERWRHQEIGTSTIVWTEGMSGWAYLIDRPEMAAERKTTTSFWLDSL